MREVHARAEQSTCLFEQEPTAVFSPLRVHFVILLLTIWKNANYDVYFDQFQAFLWPLNSC